MPGLAIRALIVSLLCSLGKLLFVRGTPVRISLPLRGLGSLFIVPHTPHLLSQRTSSLLHLSRLCITSEPGARSIPCVCTHNSAQSIFCCLRLGSAPFLGLVTSLGPSQPTGPSLHPLVPSSGRCHRPNHAHKVYGTFPICLLFLKDILVMHLNFTIAVM